MDHAIRHNIHAGTWVDIVLKKDQGTNKRVRGQVKRILTNKSVHPRGIKVMLIDGQVGRVQHILSKEEIQAELRRFYERLFALPVIYSLFNLQTQSFVVFRYTNPQTKKIERTALLFEKKEELEDFISGTPYDNGDYIAKEIMKEESIINQFLPLFVEYFRINGKRKIHVKNLKQLELRYRFYDEDDLI